MNKGIGVCPCSEESAGHLFETRTMISQFIADAQSEYLVTRLCATLGVSVSGFYAWRHCPESQHHRKDSELKQATQRAYTSSWQSYGSPRILVELQAQGYCCSCKRVARLMREQGLSACRRRVRAQTTRQDPRHQKADNMLGRDFEATIPNQKWVTDVTAMRDLRMLVVSGGRA